jgi:hypothetical protein
MGMGTMWAYLRLVVAAAIKDYAWMRDLTIGFIMSVMTVAMCIYFRLGAADDWIKHPWFLTAAVLVPYAIVICIHISWRVLKSATEMHDSLTNKLNRQVTVTGMQADDPVIEPTFVDGRRSPLGGHEHFELKNKGRSDAHWVRMAPLRLRNQIVHFPDISELIAPTDFRVFLADIGNNFGYDRHHMFINAFNAEWAGYEDSSTRREILIPARIDLESKDGVRFECNFTILYHGGKGFNQPIDFKCIECRDISYRRIPVGITPPE